MAVLFVFSLLAVSRAYALSRAATEQSAVRLNAERGHSRRVVAPFVREQSPRANTQQRESPITSSFTLSSLYLRKNIDVYG